MAAGAMGNATSQKRSARTVPSVREPLIESLVTGLGIDGEDLEQLRRTCKALVSERNRFDIARRCGGLFGNPGRRLSRSEAERAWSMAFSGEVAR